MSTPDPDPDTASRRLHVAPRPCNTCPYAKTAPPGIWHPDEYRKLSSYDAVPGNLATFHCHQENRTGVPTACRGWLTCHQGGIAVRLAIIEGRVTDEEAFAPSDVPIYESGAAAALAGLSAVHDPGLEARAAIDKLVRSGTGRPDEE